MGCESSIENDHFQTKSEFNLHNSPLNSQRIIAKARKLGRINAHTSSTSKTKATSRKSLSQSGLLFSFKLQNRVDSEHEYIRKKSSTGSVGYDEHVLINPNLVRHAPLPTTTTTTYVGNGIHSPKFIDQVFPFHHSPTISPKKISTKMSGDSERFFGVSISPSNMLRMNIKSSKPNAGTPTTGTQQQQDRGFLRRQSTNSNFLKSLQRVQSSSISIADLSHEPTEIWEYSSNHRRR